MKPSDATTAPRLFVARARLDAAVGVASEWLASRRRVLDVAGGRGPLIEPDPFQVGDGEKSSNPARRYSADVRATLQYGEPAAAFGSAVASVPVG
jgi:hypothetical protein